MFHNSPLFEAASRVSTWPVGSKTEEINGTSDMAGNEWEWVADWFDSGVVIARGVSKGNLSKTHLSIPSFILEYPKQTRSALNSAAINV